MRPTFNGSAIYLRIISAAPPPPRVPARDRIVNVPSPHVIARDQAIGELVADNDVPAHDASSDSVEIVG